MAEFCPNCFCILNPEYRKDDLEIIEVPELEFCERCGELVDEIVVRIKSTKSN